jgi:hypothetical protein
MFWQTTSEIKHLAAENFAFVVKELSLLSQIELAVSSATSNGD